MLVRCQRAQHFTQLTAALERLRRPHPTPLNANASIYSYLDLVAQVSPWSLVSEAFTHALAIRNTAVFFELLLAAPCVLACAAAFILTELRFSTVRTLASATAGE